MELRELRTVRLRRSGHTKFGHIHCLSTGAPAAIASTSIC